MRSIAAATGGKPRKYAKEFESLPLRHESLILLMNLALFSCNPTHNPTARVPGKPDRRKRAKKPASASYFVRASVHPGRSNELRRWRGRRPGRTWWPIGRASSAIFGDGQ
jgi:hypothetical protein